jgi:hypothetical protein
MHCQPSPQSVSSSASRAVPCPEWVICARYAQQERRGCSSRYSAGISSPDLGVFAVAAAGVLCAFYCVVDALSEQCLRRRRSASALFAAVFRTKWPLRGLCSATCQRRRRRGQARHRRGRLQITARTRRLPGRPSQSRSVIAAAEVASGR